MDLSLVDLSLVPLVLALTEVVKRTVGLSSRFAPLVSLALGVGATWLVGGHVDVLTGIIVGLSASGLWSGTRAVAAV